jgi:acyl phosphate:glycerol-3-phosphate acyltransferase
MPQPMDWGVSGPYLLTALMIGYLLGAIPFGLLLTRLAGLGDIRKIGSGNIGATNVLRTGNRLLAALTLLLDGGKGAAAVLIAQNFGPDVTVSAAAGAFFGHLYPVWLRFRGGKGVATFLGIALALDPLAGALACASWLLVAAIFRISSAAALAATALSPLFFWGLGQDQLMQLSLLLAVMVWLKHYENIHRLLAGTEPRIGAAGPG